MHEQHQKGDSLQDPEEIPVWIHAQALSYFGCSNKLETRVISSFRSILGLKVVENRYRYSIMCLLYRKCENDCLWGWGGGGRPKVGT